MPASNVTLGGKESSARKLERFKRPNPWYNLFIQATERSGFCVEARGKKYSWCNAVVSFNKSKDARENRRLRCEAQDELADLLQQNVKDKGGSPEDWEVVILQGWWMKETVVDGVCYIDCSYLIVPRN